MISAIHRPYFPFLSCLVFIIIHFEPIFPLKISRDIIPSALSIPLDIRQNVYIKEDQLESITAEFPGDIIDVNMPELGVLKKSGVRII